MSVLVPSRTIAVAGTTTFDVPDGNFAKLSRAAFLLDVTAAATLAGDTLDVYLQHTFDSTTFDDFVHFTQVLGNGGTVKHVAQWSAVATPTTPLHLAAADTLAAVVNQGPVGGLWRASFVVVGTGSFTFSVQFAAWGSGD